ncbi:MAG: hypothetical protein K0Q48_777 [Bacillota bacterium]|jgi:hypothetical protein|nr:hypothetical protein [Bacillota bacterium]
MKRGDILWGTVLLGVIAFLIAPGTHTMFLTASQTSPYLMGFIKFAVLASMGELLAIRIVTRYWKKPHGVLWRVIVWGIIGMSVTLMFTLFDAGVRSCMERGYLPFVKGEGLFPILVTAFFISAITNLFFGPSFMLFHRITDTWIDLGQGRMLQMRELALNEVLDAADLKGFVTFVVCRTIPAFWIPAHTVTFMLPSEYRVLMAAMLSICLGAILGISRKN